MGMFDYIECEYPLPDCPENIDPEFQTKSLHSYLEKYVITKDGRLCQNTDIRMIDTYHHGIITFYTSAGSDKDLIWVQYKAKFNDGQLTCIEREYIDWKV